MPFLALHLPTHWGEDP